MPGQIWTNQLARIFHAFRCEVASNLQAEPVAHGVPRREPGNQNRSRRCRSGRAAIWAEQVSNGTLPKCCHFGYNENRMSRTTSPKSNKELQIKQGRFGRIGRGMIIDSHQHVFWHGRDDAGLVADMDQHGIDLAWLLTGRFEARSAARQAICRETRRSTALRARLLWGRLAELSVDARSAGRCFVQVVL